MLKSIKNLTKKQNRIEIKEMIIRKGMIKIIIKINLEMTIMMVLNTFIYLQILIKNRKFILKKRSCKIQIKIEMVVMFRLNSQISQKKMMRMNLINNNKKSVIIYRKANIKIIKQVLRMMNTYKIHQTKTNHTDSKIKEENIVIIIMKKSNLIIEIKTLITINMIEIYNNAHQINK